MKKVSKKIIGLILILSLVLLFAGCSSKVVAVVNGEGITQQQFDENFNQVKAEFETKQAGIFEGEEGKQMLEALKAQLIEQMINEIILAQEAKRQGVFPENEEINQKIEEIKASYASEEEFNQVLKDNNIEMKKLVDLVGLEIAKANLLEKVTKDVKVTDKDAQAYYDENKENFQEPEKVRVRHILIGIKDADNPASADFKLDQKQAEKKAQDLLKQINQGADFAELAQKESEDLGSKENGGLLEPFSRNDSLVPEFIEASFKLEEGKVSGLVKSDYGYHIIKSEEKIPAKTNQFKDIKTQLISQLEQQKKVDEFYKYMEEVSKKAKIKNNLISQEKQTEEKQTEESQKADK